MALVRRGSRLRRLTVLLAALLARAQAQMTLGPLESFEGRRILGVRFEPARQPLVAEELARKMGEIVPGAVFQAHAFRASVQELYASGRYDDIAVTADVRPEGLILTYHTELRAFIRDISVDGVPEPPSRGQLVNATKLQLGAPFSEAAVRQAIESIQEALRLNGFYNARIIQEQQEDPETQQVDIRFRVQPGDRAHFARPIVRGDLKRPEGEVIAAARWKRFFGLGGWKEVTEQTVQQGLDRIRRSYQKKEYLQARVNLDQMQYQADANRLIPHLRINAGDKVQLRTRGAKLSRGRLRQLVPVFQEQTVDKDLLVEGQRNIRDYFQSRGYFEAEVDFEVSDNDGDQRLIEYLISPGERHTVGEIIIKGNRYFDEQTLRERLYTRQATFLRFRHGRYSADYLRRDRNAIEELYRSNGFREVKVTARVEDDYEGENRLGIFFEIEEGPQWTVRQLIIDGAEGHEEQIRGLLQSGEGQPFTDVNVAADQESVLNYFYNLGFPNAAFAAYTQPAPELHQVDLRYVISPGEQQFVRAVLKSGLRSTDPELVEERIRGLEPGAPLSQSAIVESQRRLYDLGIFARVDAAIQNPEGEEQHKVVLFRFEEARKYSLTGGFGAEIARIGGGSNIELTSPGGATGFSPRVSLGVSRSNFFGIGHTVSLQSRLSVFQRRAVLTYLAPQFKGNENLNLTFTGLYDDARDIRTFAVRRQEGAAQLGQRLSKANTVQYRIAYRRVTLDPNSIKINPQLIPTLLQPIQLGIVSGTFVEDRRDDPSDARKGIYNTVDLALASNVFGSRTSFSRLLARNATFHRLGGDFVLARSLQFGVQSNLSQADVPLPERFFGGGATSHRGFAEYQAGPRDLTTGFPVGGKAILMNTLELRYPLLGDNLSGVIFHDAGNVYSQVSNISVRFAQRDLRDFDYMVHAAGFGIRYRTPIGPIRLDLAYAINPPRFRGFRGTREQLLTLPLDVLIRDFTREQRLSRFQFHFSLGQLF